MKAGFDGDHQQSQYPISKIEENRHRPRKLGAWQADKKWRGRWRKRIFRVKSSTSAPSMLTTSQERGALQRKRRNIKDTTAYRQPVAHSKEIAIIAFVNPETVCIRIRQLYPTCSVRETFSAIQANRKSESTAKLHRGLLWCPACPAIQHSREEGFDPFLLIPVRRASSSKICLKSMLYRNCQVGLSQVQGFCHQRESGTDRLLWWQVLQKFQNAFPSASLSKP